ncbi:MAG: trypsin-like peptidase domain-containing protein [Olsenella sp.]|jgi:putative serine protease PepD|nr:trypsin-like peptidase domain-containing protein [Olsenella sp.]MCI1646161.1 trypsin-like peptidase domain-containing protein [Olsenella sp.]MCI1793761.1 trypsin-like peptidase domain-containing protein [Olsenella sp.]MCI1811637.1 trypsin-like peptidase domain-containing protein [Olsenella sp.]MCI1879270.1 trypsin-like peptidase domain-containing protein [Olsenella sp.]
MADYSTGEPGEGMTGAGSTPQQDQGVEPTQAQPAQNYDYADYGGKGAAYSPSAGYVNASQQAGSQTGQTAQQPQPVQPAAGGNGGAGGNSNKPSKDKKGGVSKPIVAGAISGVVATLVVVLVLSLTGFFGRSTTASGSSSSSGSSSTSNGTINITSNDTDASTAEAVAAKAMPSVVSVNVTTDSGEGLGSGVILDTDGDIITNYHVIDGATSISVTIDGKSYEASVVGSDSSSDLAVIKAELNGDSVTPIEVGDSSQLNVGSWVMSIGSPFGLDQSVSEGIVSALYRNELLQSSSGDTIYTNLIQVDAAINPGNSGGALVNDQGQLVGICTLYSSSTESFAGIGFAIPGNYAVEIANKIINGEEVTHAYIGLSMQTVNAQNARSNGLSVNQGAYVAEVVSGSPADEAGIQKGDIIVAMDGEEITSADGMVLAVRSHEIGDTVTVTVVRGTETKDLTVTLGSDEALQAQREQENSSTGLNGTTENGTGLNDNGTGTNGNSTTQDELEQWIEERMQQRQNSTGSYTTGSGASYSTDGETTILSAEGWAA